MIFSSIFFSCTLLYYTCTVAYCLYTYLQNFDCRNHIRVYGQLPGTDTLLVCGSNAGQGARCQGEADCMCASCFMRWKQRECLLIAGVTLTGEELGIAGNSVSASEGLVSYYPEFSGFGEFRNGEPVATPCCPEPVANGAQTLPRCMNSIQIKT